MEYKEIRSQLGMIWAEPQKVMTVGAGVMECETDHQMRPLSEIGAHSWSENRF